MDQTAEPIEQEREPLPLKEAFKNAPPPSRKEITPAMIIGIIFSLLLLAFTIFYVISTKESQPLQSHQLPTKIPTKDILPQPTGTHTTTVTKLSEAWTNGVNTYSNPRLFISFDYPSYFDINPIDVAKENAEWAQKYKNDPNVRQPLYDSSFAIGLGTPEIVTENYDLIDEACKNNMSVFVQQYENPQNISLYNFIAQLNKTYPGDGITQTFDEYKRNLREVQTPKSGSYVFEGIIGENPVKIVYFINKNRVYSISLRGGCDTGGKYSQDASIILDNMLRSVKFL